MADRELSSADELVERLRVAVVVPCLDEQRAVADVVKGFSDALPGATVFVYDNGSTDATAAVAREAGAIVRHEPARGKGNVVRRMFADIEADIYVMVDGDGTYDPSAAPEMVSTLVEHNLDMVVGARANHRDDAYRRGHVIGNRFFGWLHRVLFKSEFDDVFSGYRVMSRRFVKSFPTTAGGFEIEAELTAHALDVRAPSHEIQTAYGSRGADSASKLRTYRDGFHILTQSILFYKELRPGRFFGMFAVLFAVLGLIAAIPPIEQYADTGQVLRIPLAILAASLEIVAFLCLAAGVILDSIARGHRELKRLHYLQYHAPAELIAPLTPLRRSREEPADDYVEGGRGGEANVPIGQARP